METEKIITDVLQAQEFFLKIFDIITNICYITI